MAVSAAVEVNKAIAFVYEQLGGLYAERVYSRAIEVELRARSFVVETERPVSTVFRASDGHEYVVGPDRCDILAFYKDQDPIVLELKVRKPTKSDKVQLRKYMTSLTRETGKRVAGALVYLLANDLDVAWVDP